MVPVGSGKLRVEEHVVLAGGNPRSGKGFRDIDVHELVLGRSENNQLRERRPEMERGWTWIDEEVEHPREEALKPLLDRLAGEWSTLQTSIEQKGWARQAAMENPGECDEPDFDTDEEAASYRQVQQVTRELEGLRLTAIESQLEHFGARLRRPYEHWNEDEAIMEYAERDR
jgi:hypothetical protein